MTPSDRFLAELVERDAFVRGIARALTRDAAAAEDLAQEAYLLALGARPDAERPLLPWFRAVIRRLAARSARSAARRAKREGAAARPEAVSSTAVVVEREAARRRLVEAVLALSEPYRDVVLRRFFENQSPRRIARDLDRPLETVKSQLRRALDRLRREMDEGDASKGRDWRALLVPPAALTTSLAHAAGIALMTAKSQVLAGGAVVLVLAAFFVIRSDHDETGDGLARPSKDETQGAPIERGSGAMERRPTASPATDSFSAVAASEARAEPAAFAAIEVFVSRDDGAPVANAPISVSESTTAMSFDAIVLRSDDLGRARIDRLEPGSWSVAVEDAPVAETVDLVGGRTTSVRFVLKTVAILEGVVTTPQGEIVVGAEIVAWQGIGRPAGRTVARSDGKGRFRVRCFESLFGVGARAENYEASPYTLLGMRSGVEEVGEIKLVLRDGGADVSGRVVDRGGLGIADATIVFGEESREIVTRPLEGARLGVMPRAFLATSGADGRFRLAGLPIDTFPVVARARGLAPTTATIELRHGARNELVLTMGKGATVRGVCRQEDGAPAAGVSIRTGNDLQLRTVRTRTDARGTFELARIPSGRVELTAIDASGRKELATFDLNEGDEVEWNPVPRTGRSIRGRVLKEGDQPVPHASVWIEILRADGSSEWEANRLADASGAFLFAGLADASYRLGGREAAIGPPRQGATIVEPVTPSDQEIVLRVRTEMPTVSVTGRVIGPDKEPIVGAEVYAGTPDGSGSFIKRTGADGTFSIDSLVPNEFRVFVNAQGFVRHRTEARRLEANETWNTGDIEVARGGKVRIVARRKGGGPIGAPILRVERVGASEPEITKLQRHDDAFVSPPLLAGRYRVTAPCLAPADTVGLIDVAVGAVVEIDLELPPLLERTVRFVSKSGSRFGALRTALTLDKWPLENRFVERGADGSYQTTFALDPGRYEVELYDGDRRLAAAHLLVERRSDATAPTAVDF